MIEFKVVATVDKTQQSIYQHIGRVLTIGCEEGDMILDDPHIASAQIRIRFEGSQAILENLNPQVEVRLNGRAVEDRAPLKEHDNLTMGRTTIQFVELNLKPLEPPPPYEYPQAHTRFLPGSKETALLEVLDYLATQNGEPAAGTIPPPPPVTASPPPLPKSVPGMPTPPAVKPPPLPPKPGNK